MRDVFVKSVMVAFRIENELFLSRPDAEIEGCSRAEEPKGSFTVFFFLLEDTGRVKRPKLADLRGLHESVKGQKLYFFKILKYIWISKDCRCFEANIWCGQWSGCLILNDLRLIHINASCVGLRGRMRGWTCVHSQMITACILSRSK